MFGQLMNGLPLDVQQDEYSFETSPPRRVGDESIIVTEKGHRVHVQLLRGLGGRKRFLVSVMQLKMMLREKGNQQMIQLHEGRKCRAL